MTKLIPALCAFALFAPHGLRAAAAYPSAASNYVFTTPLRPAHIRGLVMGSPPAYLTPRSEDYDWLNEALKERLALARPVEWLASTNTVLRPEFGKWDLAETNRFHRWVTAVDAAGVTNVVVGYHLATNAPSSDGSPWALFGQDHYPAGEAAGRLWNPAGTVDWRTGYLDPDAPLVADAKLCRAATYTNIYSVAAYTNGWTNAFSTISITLANGTASVHTNSWAARRAFPATFTYTNVFESTPLDGCHAGGGPFPGYTDAPPLGCPTVSDPAAFSNDYAALRGAARLADTWLHPTNGPNREVESEYWPWGTTTRTNVADRAFARAVEGAYYSYEEWDADAGRYVTEYGRHSAETATLPFAAALVTRFPSAAATAGGAVRVEVEAAYAVADFSYTETTAGDVTYEVLDYIAGTVAVRLPSPPTPDCSGEYACLDVTMDPHSMLESAASAAGAPQPPQDASGYSPPLNRWRSWDASCNSFVVIYRIRPSSRLEGW